MRGRASVPVVHRVVAKRWLSSDTATLSLVAEPGPVPDFEPAQFSMLGAFGIGEAAISISSDPAIRTHHDYTIRRAGPISNALVDTPEGGHVTVRGPFGVPWPMPSIGGGDLLVVAGGLGLAPLRSAIEAALRRPSGSTTILYGARSPDDVLFDDDRDRWRQLGATVVETVDATDPYWRGRVGLVTELLGTEEVPVDPTATAFVCGPEPMMRATMARLRELGLRPTRIWVSLERNMQCGVGTCGHCQLGPFLVCRDGPVFDAEHLSHYLDIEEL